MRKQIELYMMIPKSTFKPHPIGQQWQNECVKTLEKSGHWMFTDLRKIK